MTPSANNPWGISFMAMIHMPNLTTAVRSVPLPSSSPGELSATAPTGLGADPAVQFAFSLCPLSSSTSRPAHTPVRSGAHRARR